MIIIWGDWKKKKKNQTRFSVFWPSHYPYNTATCWSIASLLQNAVLNCQKVSFPIKSTERGEMSVETKSFGSRLSSRPSGASQPEAPGAQIAPPSRPRTRRGRGGLLKVKFPKGAKNPDKARKGGTSEPVEETRRRGEEGAPKAPPGGGEEVRPPND